MPLVFNTARFFAINEWLRPIGFTSTLNRSQRSLQVAHPHFSPAFYLCPSLEAEEGVEGLEGLEGGEGLVLGAGLGSGAWSCVLVQHPRISVQVAVHRSFPVALVCQNIVPGIWKIVMITGPIAVMTMTI